MRRSIGLGITPRHGSSNPPSRRKANRLARFETLEPRQLLAATPIEIRAAGLSGEEQMELQIDGVTVQSWANIGGDYNARLFETFSYTHPTDVTADRIRVAFVNDQSLTRDLRIDNVTVAGIAYEAEAANVYSTGTWDDANGCAPGFKSSESLHCDGYLQFEATPPTGETVEIFAAGATGTESIELQIDNVVVARFDDIGGDVEAAAYQTLRYIHTEAVTPDRIRVVLVDGTANASGDDRNVRVDGIAIGGEFFESEHPSVYSTGTWKIDSGCSPGFKSSEFLHCTGYLEFADPNAMGGSQITIFAAGATGEERMELQIDGVTVQGWNAIGGDYDLRQFQSFRYTHPTTVTPEQIRVAFVNDGTTTTGADRNLRVDGITLDGVVHESEASNVLSTGSWDAATGCAAGFKVSESLHCNGYFQFAAAAVNPGILALGTTQFSGTELSGVLTVNFVRTNGADGVATVDYTTVDATAIAGEDYVAQSGTVVFADGETEKSLEILLLDDDLNEGTEAFNIAIDRVTGGVAGQPRTATASIFDDEAPSPGDGAGLRAEYFDGLTLTSLLLARTDASINFDWGRGAPASTVPSENFSVRWTGEVQPLYSETYIFRATTDDGVRLWVDDQLIIDQWIDQAATDHFGSITLTAGVKYSLQMEYYEKLGEAVAKLAWSSPSQSLQTVPQSQLYSEPIVPVSGDFSTETLISGLTQPTAIDFAPNGRMYIAQKNGLVRVAENGAVLSEPFIDLQAEVNNVQDRGLLGLVVDPNFSSRPYVYLLYTYDPPEVHANSGLAGPDGAGNRVSRLVRVTADASNGFRTFVPGSEVILLGQNSVWENISNPDKDGTNDVSLPESCDGVGDCLPVDSRSHSIGALAFGTDGKLYVTNGDGTSFGRVDPRSARVQRLDSLAGKVLRINPDTGLGFTDNPFFTGDVSDDASKVYAYGLRNPFRMAINPVTGEPYISDVGWNAWEEINFGRGANFGWPWYEGGGGQNLQTGGYRDLSEAQVFYASNPDVTPPAFSRSHSAGGVAMVIGDFYTGSLYPAIYQNAAFYTDFGDPTLRALRLNANGTVQQSIVVTGSVGSVVEMSMGPDGHMYYVDLNGSVGRLRFDAAETEQQAAAASVTPGSASEGPSVVAEGSLLEVFATKGDDAIALTAASGEITVVSINDQTFFFGAGFTEINIHGRDGKDRITLVGSDGDDRLTAGAGLFEFRSVGVTVQGDGIEEIVAEGGAGKNRLDLFDTPGDDQLNVRVDSTDFTAEGYSVNASGFSVVFATALAGDDVAYLGDTSGDDRYVSHPGVDMMIGEDSFFHISGYDRRNATSSFGADTAYFYDSPGDEKFVSRVGYAFLEGENRFSLASGFPKAYAFASEGADVAYLFDGAGDDTFISHADHSFLQGEGRYGQAAGFPKTYAFASGGNDVAYIHDGKGDDKLVSRPESTSLEGDHRYSQANAFERVVTLASEGNDSALFIDGPGDDKFVTGPTFSFMEGTDRYRQANAFDRVLGLASSGHDLAFFNDTPDADRFVSRAAYSFLEGPGHYAQANGFDVQTAYATSEEDRAYLFDGPNDDRFVGRPRYAILSGPERNAQAMGFFQTVAYASAGNDVAYLFDDPSMLDSFTLAPDQAYVAAPSHVTQAVGFESYLATTQGGGDVARLLDSAGDDLLTVRADRVSLRGEGFFSQTTGFRSVHAIASTGYDSAKIHDTALNELLVAEGAAIRVTVAGAIDNLIENFDHVEAQDDISGDDDELAIGTIDFVFESLGDWT